ncbi:phosphate/phosphite/phosphonate ABC transporter substrate-binding protein [Desulfolutivibrio sulfoxidireducens]|uniref:phosphate/phosphite/phosphonate ABC transporter substrate-binding protein n=1 Tax=Desulfolutivibrio sulfoxidireducens TaxID=2773299 RepID=UPI00159D99B4|nr:phosphate/phosphite/phosphonate ABC transporter substrate-binding protein [Desulfolutivibrio sulfoxidireducens]QLA16749.1 PhnD/SsuA/transferrin family substrate-binding protein [Desulfolutivibrio sulfoxidireducens]QLA20314.1 PhnD/SsuA/transferrin family substrate-binding protein [Desulfolutivibrio sulfoxidireducens]
MPNDAVTASPSAAPLPRHVAGLAVLVLLAFLAPGCEKDDERAYSPTYGPEPAQEIGRYVFGVHPLHNPKKLHEVYGPLIEYLNSRLKTANIELTLEASRSYESFDEKLYSGHFHFALPNPYQTIRSVEHGYVIFGKMGNDEDFRGIILLRKDSPIKDVSDLRGKTISYPAPTALAATMMPQMFLMEHGVDVRSEVDNLYAGSQESSIMSVYVKQSAAGATWPPPWRNFQKDRPDIARDLYVKWQTDPLPSNGLVVRGDIPGPVRDRVAAILFSLQESPDGRAILERLPLSSFVPADNATYAPVHEFLARFKASVRNPEE